MKRFFTSLVAICLLGSAGKSQLLLNELYSDPGAGNHEFFELYNTSTSNGALSVDNVTLVTFFDISGSKGFYVMDLPNLSVAARGFFVGSAALPFNYQGTLNSTASDFSWNSIAFTSNNGYLKKWARGTANLLDGNLFYDEQILPANFNDFLYRRTGSGASYTVFMYRNGTLINSFIGGTGGNATILTEIVNMPPLFVNMTSTAPDFTINFSGYGSLPTESCTQDAGSDNGYIREFDGACATWTKSSAQVQHTPRASNGNIANYENSSVVISAAISKGTVATGSILNSNIVSAPSSYFPIELQVFTDLGTDAGRLDADDVYITSNTETTVSDGPFFNTFFPYDAHILIAAKTSAGCFDRVMYLQNTIILSAEQMSFSGTKTNNQIALTWSLEKNELVSKFEVQQSTNGQDFTTIAQVFTSEQSGYSTYSYHVSMPTGPKSFYRLRIFNKNNTVEYSKTISFDLNNHKPNMLVLLNNPATDKISFVHQAITNEPVSIRIIDMSGRVVQQNRLNTHKGNNQVNIPLNNTIRTGTYIVDLQEGDQHFVAKFIKH